MEIWRRETRSHHGRAWTRCITLLIVLMTMCVLVRQESASAATGITITADQLGALCAAGGGHIAVATSLTINGGVALLTDECDITPGAGARVRIVDAYIEAQDPNGDFDICFSPACGDNVSITITNSTLVSCATGCGMQILAPGSRSSIVVTNSAFSSGPTTSFGGTNFTSDGRVTVTGSHFLRDTTPGIHGAVSCRTSRNTPSTAVCN